MEKLDLQRQYVNDWMSRNGARFSVIRQGQRQVTQQPFDPIPRVLSAQSFTHLEQGLIQRVNAMNIFLNDIYGSRMILLDGLIPEEFVLSSPDFQTRCMGIAPPKNIYTHITATDLVKGTDGIWYAMEDSLSVPGGATYPHFARKLCREIAPENYQVSGLCDNCGLDILLKQLYRDITDNDPELEGGIVVLLSEGPDADSHFELEYMAQLTGAVVAQADQLIVMDSKVYYRAPEGSFQRVAILHRLALDRMLDPLCFEDNTCCGVPHLMEAYAAGHLAILNAPGCCLAEDRGLNYFIPTMIRYYLDEEPILPNVPTLLPWYPEQRSYILSHIPELIFKDVSSSRRIGAIYGQQLTLQQQEALSRAICREPRRYIAQKPMEVETQPVLSLDGSSTSPARCDLRAYTVHSDSLRVWMGGLSRFTVQNADGRPVSGFKDTWVMSE